MEMAKVDAMMSVDSVEDVRKSVSKLTKIMLDDSPPEYNSKGKHEYHVVTLDIRYIIS